MDEICNQKKFNYKKHQQFISKWMDSGNKKLLLFHGLGSGKTCTSILAAKTLLQNRSIKNVYVITPASLIENYKKELLGPCGKYSEIPDRIKLFSYDKFIKSNVSLNNSLVIIDEVQNMVSAYGKLYTEYIRKLATRPYFNFYVILLSATPIFDKSDEIALTLNLLKPENPLPTGTEFYTKYVSNGNIINQNDFLTKIHPYVSAFKGISENAYATSSYSSILCPMINTQAFTYSKLAPYIKKWDCYNITSRLACNVVYPDGTVGNKHKPSKSILTEALSQQNIKKHSIKFYKLIEFLLNSEGLVFVYSNFVNSGGVAELIIALENHGFKSYTDNPGEYKGFGIFKTSQDVENNRLLQTFNTKENKYGKNVRVIIGSPAMKEGVSLKNVQHVHILEPYWNYSRINQIVGRAIRFCSHLDLPKSKRHVNIKYYVATLRKITTIDKIVSALALKKNNLVKKFEDLLYKGSIDCKIFHNPNGYKKEECFTAKVKTNKEIKNIKQSNAVNNAFATLEKMGIMKKTTFIQKNKNKFSSIVKK